jgi:hypothetical protein
MIYADVFYYKTMYFGKIEDEDELNRVLERASEKIDVVTFNRSRNFMNLSNFEKEMIQKACCAEADIIFEYGEQDVDLGSYSIGDVSISNSASSSNTLMSKKAQSYLNNTNLVCRIL